MKNRILIAVALLLSSLVYGQFQVHPISFDTTVSANIGDFSLDSEIKNIGKTAIEMEWKRTVVSMPKTWDNYICTYTNCYPPEISTGSFILAGNDVAPLLTHFTPNETSGMAVVTVTLTEKNKPETSVTVTYTINATTTATNDLIDPDLLIIYPNPSIDYFAIKNTESVSKVSIQSVSGKIFKTFKGFRETYNIAELPNGVYVLQLYDVKNNLLKSTMIAIQRS